MLIDLFFDFCGPLVNFRQFGLEHRLPTRFDRISLVLLSKSSRFITVCSFLTGNNVSPNVLCIYDVTCSHVTLTLVSTKVILTQCVPAPSFYPSDSEDGVVLNDTEPSTAGRYFGPRNRAYTRLFHAGRRGLVIESILLFLIHKYHSLIHKPFSFHSIVY